MSIKNIAFLGTIALFLSISACKKDLPRFYSFEGYEFASTDAEGGTWKPILLSSPTDISVAAPAAGLSSEYQAEITAMSLAIDKMSSKQAENVAYWSQNPVVRWNEIALELAAKYNLVPGPNEDGTYTLPNANNPAGPPAFPFAHPPYTVRMLSYLSVAQYDGLIAAWHYKYLYKRSSPFMIDRAIPYAYVPHDIPSYPSDASVVSTVSVKILSQMFPLEVEYLKEQEAAHKEAMILSGGYVNSDIEAGVLIGDKVATLALERAASDGMKNAQAPKAISDSLATSALNRYGWKWENQEIPQRQVGLVPLFGRVKPWNVTNISDTRSIPPPALTGAVLEAETNLLKGYADNLTIEQRKIANFWADGVNTYTPPGHWNRIAKELIIKYRLNPLRSVRTYAYLNTAMMDAGISCWDTKYYYYYPRPNQVIKDFKTILGTPNFPAYTSGHSVFSASAAEVLTYIFPSEVAILNQYAEEAAQSRLYGGIHWSFDASEGLKQGRAVAKYCIDKAKVDGADQ